MKFDINKNELLKVLNFAQPFIGSNNTLPIIENVKFDYNKDLEMAFIEGTCLDASIRMNITIDNLEGEFKPFSVNHYDITKLISLIDYDIVNIETVKNTMTITTPFLDTFDLPTTPVSEFPEINFEVGDEHGLSMTSKMFSSIISEFKDFCGRDELRPVLSSIYFESEGTDLVITATNAHMLYHKVYKNHLADDSKIEFLLPNHPALKKFYGDELFINYNESTIIVNGGSYLMSFVMTVGKYPNYKAVIPDEENAEYTLEIDTAPFANNLKIATVLSPKASKTIAIEKKEDKLTLRAEDLDFNKKGVINIKGTSSNDMQTGFNNEFFKILISHVSDDTFKMYGSKNRANVIVETVAEDTIEKLLLLMPVMLTDGSA